MAPFERIARLDCGGFDDFVEAREDLFDLGVVPGRLLAQLASGLGKRGVVSEVVFPEVGHGLLGAHEKSIQGVLRHLGHVLAWRGLRCAGGDASGQVGHVADVEA